jgi:hypothetical protein
MFFEQQQVFLLSPSPSSDGQQSSPQHHRPVHHLIGIPSRYRRPMSFESVEQLNIGSTTWLL